MGEPEFRLVARLALAMGRPISWVLARVPACEWPVWVALYAAEPFGPRQDDVRAGVVAASFHNAWGGRADPSDYFPSLRDKATKTDRLRAATIARCPAFGGG